MENSMRILKIKDNTQLNKEDFSMIPTLTRKIADRTLVQLEKEDLFIFPEIVKDAEDITKDQMILQSVNEKYRSGNIMGFLGCGNERLVIGSRFSVGQEDYFFQYLLERVLDVPNIFDLETDANMDNQLFSLLLFLFPKYLESAMRKGPFKQYIYRKYNDSNMKGIIDVARHIRLNTPFIGKVAYNQREFSYDNDLMELIRHTIEFIEEKPYGHTILSKVKDEVKAVVEVTNEYQACDRLKVIDRNKKSTVRHAYYHEYRSLQRLCLLILQKQKHGIGLGNRQIYGILFDGSWLWEEYVNTLIGKKFYHPKNKGGTGAQRLFEGNNGLIYPDFIGRSLENRMIADAKYKPIKNIGRDDYQQVLAYMFRFDAKTGFYIYPDAQQTGMKRLRMNQGSTYEKNVRPREDISVTKIGLKIPDIVSSYEEFVVQMQQSENEFTSVFAT